MANSKAIHDLFRWSEREYSMVEFLERFEMYRPFLLMVTDGYTGRDDWLHQIDSYEVYWFHDVAYQARIVVQDDRQNHFSIPECYQSTIIPTRHNGTDGEETTIAEMVSSGGCSSFRFARTQQHRVYRGADSSYNQEMGRLHYTDRYNERFLVLHSLMHVDGMDSHSRKISSIVKCGEGQAALYPEFFFIPAYTPIYLTVAVELCGCDEDEFHRTMFDMKEGARKSKHDYTAFFKKVADILQFDSTPAHGDYEYIHLMKYDTAWKTESSADCQSGSDKKSRPMVKTPTKKKKAPKVPKHSKSRNDAVSKGIQRQESLGKDRVPTPPLVSEEEESLYYSEVMSDTTSLSPSTYSAESTSSSRIGPVAYDIIPEDVLMQLKRVLREGPKKSMELWMGASREIQPSSMKQSHDNQGGQVPTLPARKPTRQRPTPQRRAVPAIQPDLQQKANSSRRRGDTQDSQLKNRAVIMPNPRNNTESPSELSATTASPRNAGMTVNTRENDKFESLQDVPKDITVLSVQDITRCLSMLNMSRHQDVFMESQVDGKLLTCLDEGILQGEFGLNKFEAIKLMKFAKEGWRPTQNIEKQKVYEYTL